MSEISRQQRRAAERAKAKRLRGEPQQGSNTRVLVAASISALLVLVIATLVLVKFSQGSDSNTATRTTATSAAARSVMSLPASAFNAVGYQKDVTLPSAIKGAAVNANGKPVVIYLGAEYCPYCAAQRWAMVAALGRFGTFTKLGSTTSSSIDVFPSTPTFTFHKSVYSSPYVVLSAVETASNKVKDNRYAPLDQPTKEQIAAYNAHNSAGTIPFTDFGGKYALTGSSYNPQVLQGLTPNQIAADLHDPNSTVAKAVLGSANGLTAAICSATGGKPANVCSSSAVTATAPHLAK